MHHRVDGVYDNAYEIANDLGQVICVKTVLRITMFLVRDTL